MVADYYSVKILWLHAPAAPVPCNAGPKAEENFMTKYKPQKNLHFEIESVIVITLPDLRREPF